VAGVAIEDGRQVERTATRVPESHVGQPEAVRLGRGRVPPDGLGGGGDAVRHQLAYLGVAYTAVWAGIAGYLAHLARRQRAVERRLHELEGPDQGARE